MYLLVRQNWSRLAHVDESFLFRSQIWLGTETGCHQYRRPPSAGRFPAVNKLAKTVSICPAANDSVLTWCGSPVFTILAGRTCSSPPPHSDFASDSATSTPLHTMERDSIASGKEGVLGEGPERPNCRAVSALCPIEDSPSIRSCRFIGGKSAWNS